jgi:hypothetical protein
VSEFETKLSAMVSKELCGDADAIGALIERLTNALGLAIAVASRGDGDTADTLFEGATAYLTEAIAHHEKLARFMAQSGFRKNIPARSGRLGNGEQQ